jgi:aldehyde dehydrogenase (NAD+)
MHAQAFQLQREYFRTGGTLPLAFRLARLRELRELLTRHEAELSEALRLDLGKSAFEAYATEIGMVLQEIDLHTGSLAHWARRRRVATPLVAMPARSYIEYAPRGVVLILAPWNYPLQLALMPLVGAIAAGDCAILKPSEHSPHTSALLARLLNGRFPAGLLRVVTGTAAVSAALCALPFDLIFFTGGGATGRKVLRAAAENLTPVVLELGGKCPCVVHADADIELAARRIVWGKCLNAGQTCIAPDYLLVHASVKDALVAAIGRAVQAFFGADMARSPDYGRIVAPAQFARLLALRAGGRIIAGGAADAATLYMELTLLEAVDLESPLLREEIFGPLLPIVAYTTLDEAIGFINDRPQPLAAYVFSRTAASRAACIGRIRAGGMTVNDTLLHCANSALPFGGVGPSGMGSYHGWHSFAVFSHAKAVLVRAGRPDNPLRYPPYGDKLRLLRRLLPAPAGDWLTRPRPLPALSAAALSLLGMAGMLWARQAGVRAAVPDLATAASMAFVLTAILAGGLGSTYGRRLTGGLLLCLLGDILGPGDFMLGLYAFLAAHFGIGGAFLARGVSWRNLARAAPVAVLASALAWFFWLGPHLPAGDRLPVAGYTVVITLMLVAAGATPVFAGKSLALGGAVLFYISDLFLANWHYVGGGGWNAFVCYPLYYTACVLLALSILPGRRAG